MANTDELRRRAEGRLVDDKPSEMAVQGDLQRLVHELRVHQIELEVQNEDLLEAQAALRASESKYRLISDLASDAIMWISADGQQMIYASPACETVFGHAAEEFIAHPGLLLSLIHPGDRDAYREHCNAAAAAGPARTEFRVLHRDGTMRWIEQYSEPMNDENGTYQGQRSCSRDITERKRSEEALRALTENLEAQVAERTAQLKAASEAKSEFLAHMSHEIRTPMNVVINLARLLQEEPLTPEQGELLGTIVEAGDSLMRIINDILDFSKIEAGQLRIERRPFELTSLLSRVEGLLGGATAAKGLGFAIQAPSSGQLRPLMGDAMRLEQVLVNLINNAIKFTSQGSVTLNVAVSKQTGDGVRLRFEVRDTGIGMEPEVITILFQPFTQADSGITRRFGGTGLGLAICKQVVALMGGEIGVTSEPGQGSTFWFELPFAWATSQAPATVPANLDSATEPRLAGLRVLAADDNQHAQAGDDNRVNLLIVDKILKGEGATTSFAVDGQQALQILQANPQGFDVILMDVQMPVMDGLTATRAIRSDPSMATLPIIALTAGVLEAERERARDAGVDDFLAKPLDPKQLVAILAEIRQRRTGG